MFHNKFSRFLAVFITVMSLCAFGCQPQPEEVFISDLYGTWISSFNEYYEISENSFKNYGDVWKGYEGDFIKIIPNENDNTSGTIFIKYTSSLCSTHLTYDKDATDVGKWYAINYKNLTEDSVSLSGANKADGKTSTQTLDEAKKEFTVENGYFSYYSECKKSK